MAKRKALLKLSSIAPDPTYIEYDGVEFELKQINQLGVRQQARIGSLVAQAEALQVSDLSSEKDCEDLVKLYDQTMHMMLPTITDEVLELMNVEQYKAIIDLFTETSLGATEKTPTAAKTE